MIQRNSGLAGFSLLLFCALFLLTGCAEMFGGSPRTETGTNPKKQATYYLHVYNAQLADTMAMAKMTNLTEAQKKIVREKKALLIKLKPLIDLYSSTVDAGQIPSADTEAQINQLINELIAKGGG